MSSEKEFVEVFIKNWGNIKKALDEMEIEFWLLTKQKKEGNLQRIQRGDGEA